MNKLTTTPHFDNESDQFAWTALRMGGADFQIVLFRDEFQLKWYVGMREVTHQITSFVRRGFIQMIVVNQKITIIFPNEPGWRT